MRIWKAKTGRARVVALAILSVWLAAVGAATPALAAGEDGPVGRVVQSREP